jgi:hypothetical protein
MAASQIAVAHGGMAHPAAVAHGGKSPLLYIRRKKEREGWEGEGRRVRGWSSEALLVLHFIVSISTISTIRNRI